MIDDLKSIAIFAETAKHGSFRKAAENLSLSPSVVSYHVSQLEKRLQTPLLYRSTRKISLTHQGEILFQHAAEMIESAKQGMNKLLSHDGVLTGKLTITLPSALTRSPLSMRIAEFSKKHRGISLRLMYNDLRQDLVARSIDVAIRAGELEDSAFKAKKIGTVKRKLVCSHDYLSKQPKPQKPKDLESWNWIWFELMPKYRKLISPKGETYTISYNSNISVDNVEAMVELCCHGLGLSTPPDFLVQDAIDDGKLVELIPDWRLEDVKLSALWHANSRANINIRTFLEFIQDSAHV